MTVDLTKISKEQEYVMQRHSRMVGKILDLVEASLPEGTQCEKLKKLLLRLSLLLQKINKNSNPMRKY